MYEVGAWRHRLIASGLLVLAASSAAVAAAFFYASSRIDRGTEQGDEIPASGVTAERPSASPVTAVPPPHAEDAALSAAPPTESVVPPPAVPPPEAREAQEAKADPAQVVDVPILVYHSVMPHHPQQTAMQVRYDVAPEIFDRQMRYLKDNGFGVMAMDGLVHDLVAGEKPPEKSVVINFDDGNENQYRYALPILEKYGLTATFFICTRCLGRSNYMSWKQVQDLAAEGMTIGDHSATHPLLYAIKDPARLDAEVAESKQELEKAIGKPVDLFAYPFGKPSPEAEAAVRRAGYSAARIFQGGLLNSKRDLLVLRSVIVTDNFADFENLLVGAGSVK